MKVKIALIGANGRMGLEITKLIEQDKNLVPYVAISRIANTHFKHSSDLLTFKELNNVDVIIDFSSIDLFDDVLKAAIKFKKPLISGVTGISEKQKKALHLAAKKIPVLWSSNMSLGVAVLKEALTTFAALKGFDFQIEEFHHNRKKDSPSGTAITLQGALESAIGKKAPYPIGIRGGGIFGVHKVWAMGEEETLCFEHQALNRTVFAKGAIQAAIWISKKKASGLYSMKEVLF